MDVFTKQTGRSKLSRHDEEKLGEGTEAASQGPEEPSK